MADAKPFASLSSGLLARKGQAKPAMRPQGFAGFGIGSQDDLGWNDMGYDAPRAIAPQPVAPPAVVRQREELAEELGAAPEPVEAAPVVPLKPVEAEPVVSLKPVEVEPVVPLKPVAVAPVRAPRRVTKQPVAAGRKAAFTLRLDHERHLRLRLACAVNNCSAQQLVTEALDSFLNAIPEIDDLAGRIPARQHG